jgi:hypothetical protein
MEALTQLLPLNARHVLAFARRYAQERGTGVASLISRELVLVWPQLPRWEQEKHQQELSEHRATWDQADREAWQQVLDLPLRADDETPMPAAIQELAASKELKGLPPHLNRTRKLLAKAKALTPAVEDTLTLASTFYQEMPQASALFAMTQDRNRIQDEMERLSGLLLDERKETAKLKQQLAAHGGPAKAKQVKHQVALDADARANEKISLYMQHNSQLEISLAKVAEALTHPLSKPETKIGLARKEIASALAKSNNRKKRILARKLEELSGAALPDEAVAAAATLDSSL